MRADADVPDIRNKRVLWKILCNRQTERFTLSYYPETISDKETETYKKLNPCRS